MYYMTTTIVHSSLEKSRSVIAWVIGVHSSLESSRSVIVWVTDVYSSLESSRSVIAWVIGVHSSLEGSRSVIAWVTGVYSSLESSRSVIAWVTGDGLLLTMNLIVSLLFVSLRVVVVVILWWLNYLSNQCLSPQKLWVRIPVMARCTRTSDRSMIIPGYCGFLHQ